MRTRCNLIKVDAHNIVPCWVASDKQEHGARRVWRKIHDQLAEFLTEFPPVVKHPYPGPVQGEDEENENNTVKYLSRDIFQLRISTSTTPDLIEIGMKLQEFFIQQFNTSKSALSTRGPVPYFPKKTVVNIVEESSHQHLLDARPHHQWPGGFKVVSMSLHGNHMKLACFHRPNFHSQSWASFHLDKPNTAFWTEAQNIWQEGSREHSTSMVQMLDFPRVTNLGGAPGSPMATTPKGTRRRLGNPPHGGASGKVGCHDVVAIRNEGLNIRKEEDDESGTEDQQ
ncbi:bridge-like lipid transfer protein family member 1 isoform X1 [Paroedura picta]|uniref:bridge-like lipid transfer protein family member 1 isoform X1 n=1 Tax=Paroedura picta TaxID=143630 RepID=UPI004055D7A7